MFEVWADELNKYPTQNVGAKNHNELWIPCEDLELFNQAIVGNIEVIRVFVGEYFKNAANEDVERLILKLKK
nr:hypothetical protein [uncultured Chryseobacterium sp.]